MLGRQSMRCNSQNGQQDSFEDLGLHDEAVYALALYRDLSRSVLKEHASSSVSKPYLRDDNHFVGLNGFEYGLSLNRQITFPNRAASVAVCKRPSP